MTMKRNKWPEGELPEPLPDDSLIMTRTGYTCRVRRRGRVKIYHENVEVVVKRGKEVKESYEEGEWQYYLVHEPVIGGRVYPMNGSQLFTHSQLVADKVVLLREWPNENAGAQEDEQSCQTQEATSPKHARSRSTDSSETSGTGSLASRVLAAARRRRCSRRLCRKS